MKATLSRLMAVVVAFSLVCSFGATPASAANPEPPTYNGVVREQPARAVEIPAEIRDNFPQEAMSVEEFIAYNGGRVPHALEGAVEKQVAVIIELDQAPLLASNTVRMTTAAQRTYVAGLEKAQASLAPQIEAKGAQIISSYTKIYNGFLARVPMNRMNDLRALPGVKNVYLAPKYYPDLGASVPLIGAYDVWADPGYDGTGVNIAIVDTGIDYTHAVFGGSGNPADYTANDPDIIETGTFPTAKVVGGYDFAGTDYNANEDTDPVPDSDPLDENSHGTHVASIAAGIMAGDVMTGVAPMAKLFALKVFGAEGSTNLVPDALEWVATHNLSATTEAEKIHVVNMSLGSDYGPNNPADPEMIWIDNLTASGVVVVISAGNAGNTPYIVGSPSVADSAISVAGSTAGYATGPTVEIVDTPYITQTGIVYQVPSFDGGTGHYTEAVTAELGYVGALTTSTELCSIAGIPANALEGKVALIQRGTCAFTVKVNNAAALGAVGALIYNSAAGGNELVTMAGTPVAIPAGFIALTHGQYLIPADGEQIHVSAEDEVSTVPSLVPPDSVYSSSSRGPRGLDSKLKPEIAAPAVGIFAALMGTGTQGAAFSGTSMAAPHVTGVAALMKQAHPSWTAEQIKAAMMNTAADMIQPYPIARVGAGRVDAAAAAETKVVAVGDEGLVSLSYGVVYDGDSDGDGLKVVGGKKITVYNWETTAQTYTVAAMFHTTSITDGITFEFDPATVEVPAGGSASVAVTMTMETAKMPAGYSRTPEEVSGYAMLTNTGDESVLRVPFYFQPRPYTELTMTDSNTVIESWLTDVVTATFDKTGAIDPDPWAYPVLVTDVNEAEQVDAGDLRMLGMDYGWTSETYGPVFVVAFSTYGPWHTMHPYFAGFALYLDVDMDGVTDWIVFNADANTLSVYVPGVGVFAGAGSPYYPYTDFNAGFAEWYLPASWVLDVSTTFNYQMVGFDWEGNPDPMTGGTFDWDAPPLALDWDFDSTGGEASAEIWFLDGYFTSEPVGFMVVDYVGDPRDAGQAYFVPIEYGGEKLTIEKTAEPTVMDAVAGGVITYTVTLANPGTEDAVDVMFEDVLPTMLSFGNWVSQPTGVINVGDTITWTGTVPAEDSVEFAFTATLPGSDTISLLLAEGEVTNTATFEYLGGSGSDDATTRFYRYIYLPLVMRAFTATP